ncbi:hypothetical protein So717_35780 [Roseobacter cerasinus]|uniref:Diguanylate cyclase/phosphodiesterase n=2 Tax=Roseobacter cerasinus TaxID=2602289 RepID=A0A640VXZ6_9RHOB|nr:hypothetical protein So717_35780 [Roseobacter cerasinus]
MEERLSVDTQMPFNDGDAFVYIDLDEFKPINDAFGHGAGDKVLQEVAERLKNFAPDKSELWRLGGDEYGFVVRNAASPEHLSFLADRLQDIVSAPIAFAGKELFVGVSIGVAIHDDAVLHPQDMFARADVAMFTAKNNPHKNFEIYGSSLQTRRYGNEARRDVVTALENGAIFPVFQPQINLNTGEVTGFEALARWRRPNGEVSTPAEFLDVVEYFGSQAELDILIAGRTIQVMRHVHEQGTLKPRFSMNVSESSLASRETRDGYLDLFKNNEDLVSWITVEVTENALLDRSAQAIRSSLQSFSAAGVSLSMDDFGTGYGSFRHLQEYSFDEVKIDKSFVAKLFSDHSSEVIISGFLHVAKGLNASVVAEGVETEEQRHKLAELGCHFGQGYLFAKPICAEDVVGFLESGFLARSV